MCDTQQKKLWLHVEEACPCNVYKNLKKIKGMDPYNGYGSPKKKGIDTCNGYLVVATKGGSNTNWYEMEHHSI